jgi:hypothetical protein
MALFPIQNPNAGGIRWGTGRASKWPWAGVDDTPMGPRRILQMPGCIDVVHPGHTLRGAPASIQTVRSLSNRYLWTSQGVESSSVETVGAGGKLLVVNDGTFQPDTGVDLDGNPGAALVLPETAWTIYGVINITTPDTLQYLFGTPDTPAGAGNERFAVVVLANNRLAVVDLQPSVGSEAIANSTYTGGLTSFAICFSSSVGVAFYRNGVADGVVTTDVAKVPMSPLATQRIFQLFGQAAAGSLPLKGKAGYLSVFSDYHAADGWREVRTAVFNQMHADYGIVP